MCGVRNEAKDRFQGKELLLQWLLQREDAAGVAHNLHLAWRTSAVNMCIHHVTCGVQTTKPRILPRLSRCMAKGVAACQLHSSNQRDMHLVSPRLSDLHTTGYLMDVDISTQPEDTSSCRTILDWQSRNLKPSCTPDEVSHIFYGCCSG